MRPAARGPAVPVLLAVVIGLAAAASHAQTQTGSISGFVRDDGDGEGLIGATVLVPGTNLGTLTNPQGYYVLPRVPAGTRRVVFTYIGHRALEREVTVVAGADARLDVRLVPEAVRAAETVIRADSMRTAEQLYRKPVSQIRLSSAQIEAVPQVAEADLLRTLQSLPGVLPLSDFSSALYVRGGTPDQNLYLIDGTDVYNPEHTFGIFSTFNTDAIKQAELSKGGFGAQYGGRLSSVLDVTNLDGNREEFEGTATLSLLSAKTTLQAPLGSRGSLSGSIRRTYFDQTVAQAIDDLPDYWFYDGNLKAFVEVSDRDQLTLSTYGGRDFLDVVFNPDASEETGFSYDWGNKTGSLRWMRVLAPTTVGTFWVTGSRFTSDFELPIADVTERNEVTDITLKAYVEHHHSDAVELRAGIERKDLGVRFRQDFPEGLIDIDTEPTLAAGFLQATWRPTVRWDLEAGLRASRFDNDRTFTDVAPRLALKHRLTDTINLRAAGGVYYQYLHRIPRFVVTDIWFASNRNQGRSRSVHAIVGVQKEMARNFQLEVEAYWKGYADILQFNPNFLTELRASGYDADDNPIWSDTHGLFDQGDGRSVGLEAMLRKDRGALTGWIAGSYARTRYEFPGINADRDFAPRHDRSWVINWVSNLDLANGWRKLRGRPKSGTRGAWTLGTSFVYGSGQPLTDPGSHYFIHVSPGANDLQLAQAPTVINGMRLPAYARLDVSLTWHKEFGGWSLAPYVQLFNAGNRGNVWFVDYDFDNGRPDIDTITMFPLLPTIGVTFTF